MRAGPALAVVSLAFVACSPERALVPAGGSPPPLPLQTPGPEEDGFPMDQREEGGTAMTARRIARQVADRNGLVEVWGAESRSQGRVVIYAVRFRLDERSEHPEFDDWNAHVRMAARQQRQAAVSMLRRTVRALPRVRLVSVYQDVLLQPFWDREQIEALEHPGRYRAFDAWQDLVLSAAVLPGRTGV